MNPSDVVIARGSKRAGDIYREIREWHGHTGNPRHDPSKQPIAIDHENKAVLALESCLASGKCDGVFYSLYLTTEGRGETPDPRNSNWGMNQSDSPKPIAVMADRGGMIYEVEVMAPLAFFKGTLLEGELVQYGGVQQRFLVFGAIAYKGASLKYKNQHEQYEYASRCVPVEKELTPLTADTTPSKWQEQLRGISEGDRIVCMGNKHSLAFQLKPVVEGARLAECVAQIAELPYRCDGLIFTFRDRTLKWKAETTIDIVVESRIENGMWLVDYLLPDSKGTLSDIHDVLFGLRDRAGAKDVQACLEFKSPDPILLTILNGSPDPTSLTRHVIEFNCELDRSHLIPTDCDLVFTCRARNVRLDKTHGNSERTLQHSMQTVLDAVGISDLLALVQERDKQIKAAAVNNWARSVLTAAVEEKRACDNQAPPTLFPPISSKEPARPLPTPISSKHVLPRGASGSSKRLTNSLGNFFSQRPAQQKATKKAAK